jgi:hypothetical protein
MFARRRRGGEPPREGWNIWGVEAGGGGGGKEEDKGEERVSDYSRSFPCKRPIQNESLYVEHESSPQSLGNTIEEKDILTKKTTAELCIH